MPNKNPPPILPPIIWKPGGAYPPQTDTFLFILATFFSSSKNSGQKGKKGRSCCCSHRSSSCCCCHRSSCNRCPNWAPQSQPETAAPRSRRCTRSSCRGGLCHVDCSRSEGEAHSKCWALARTKNCFFATVVFIMILSVSNTLSYNDEIRDVSYQVVMSVGGLWQIAGLHAWASKGCSCRCNTMVFPCRSSSWRKARGSPSACWLYATGISTRHADEDAELSVMATAPAAVLASHVFARDLGKGHLFFCDACVFQQQVIHVSHRSLWQDLFKWSATAPLALVLWRIMKIQNILDPYQLNQNHTCSPNLSKISNFWPQALQLIRHHGRPLHQLHMLRMQLLIQLRNTAQHNSSHQRSGKWHAAIQLCGRLMLGLAFVSGFVVDMFVSWGFSRWFLGAVDIF